MKILILPMLFLFFFATTVNSQQVTFDDLVKMNNDKASDAMNHLPEKKKWTQETSKTNRADSAVLVFKMEYNKQEKAKHWVSVYSEYDKPKSVSYQTTNEEYISKIIKEIDAAGFTLSNTKITDTGKVLYYTKDLLKVEVTTHSPETNLGPVFLVTLNS